MAVISCFRLVSFQQVAEDDIVKVKTEENNEELSSDSLASSVKDQSKDETQPTCSTTTTTTVKTESLCDTTRTRLRSGAFGTSTYSRRRL